MNLENTIYFDLVELIEKQGEIIKRQTETIAKLVNENAEKENMINSLINDWLRY